MHRRIISVHSNDLQVACEAVRDVDGTAEWTEVRLDALWPGPPDEADAAEALGRLLEAAEGRPLLATLRPRRQGGGYDGPEEVRLGLLAAAAKIGFVAVDLESDFQDLGGVARVFRDDADVVLSDHTSTKAPAREGGLIGLLRMQDAHAGLQKLAYPAGAFPDALRGLELAHTHAARNGAPVVTPTGFGGARLRALLALAGNRATYGGSQDAPAPQQALLSDIQAVWDHWGITSGDLDGTGTASGWYAVLGASVGHSLSPRIHNAALRRAGRPERYGALDVPDSIGSFRLLCTVAPRIGLLGASVTNPLKGYAFDSSEPDETAKAVGAANCLRFDDGTPAATNTDATAFRRILARTKPADLVVLGAGGAARAALWAARELGIPATFTSRDPERAGRVQDDLDAEWVPWEDRVGLSGEAWVQATTVDPAIHPEGAKTAIELQYTDGPTPFLQSARKTVEHVVDGTAFLIEQALDAFRFWTGDTADRTMMEAVLP